MPSFLSKVFGRKKDEKSSPTSGGRGSDGSLLDGKFEAVSQPVSPSVTEFPENAPIANGKEKAKEKDGGFGLFKVKSRPSRPSSPELLRRKDDLPQLSLVLPVPKEDAQARALDVVFEADPDAQILTDVIIGSRRLTPLEALILVRTCSQAIITRGLETLGLMHPHWYSASPETQRRLISLFIHSLNPNNAITTLSPTSIFESEVNFTHSPHDVAAVLRWGLRHLELSGSSFGKEESWYRTFAEAERKSEYPSKVYTEGLTPLVPPAHLELLNATLDLFSSLAAHSEKNSTSASKLTRSFGLWLLAAQRVDEKDDWPKFYARWQTSARILEHLFLARIRDESLRVRMPARLTELVTQYPFTKGATTDDDVFLRPRLTTRQFEALFVRVETEFSSPQEKVQRHPLQFIKDALSADVAVDGNDYSSLWEKIRRSSNDEDGASPGYYPGLSRVFADETVRYLTLIPGDHPWKATSPTFSIMEVPQETPRSRRYASSPGPGESSSKHLNGTTNGHIKPASDPSPIPSAAASPLDTDWSQFSSIGFSNISPSVAPLASTLFGQDVEKTNPPFRKSSRRSKAPSRSPSATRKSTDVAAPRVSNVSQPDIPKLVSKSIPVSLVQIDEAFLEFWVDSILDPIASNWPKFVLCKLRSSLSDLIVNEKRIEYLVIEHVFVAKPPPPAPAPPEVVEPAEAVSSPEKSAASSQKSPTKSEKRFFGFFTSSGRNSGYASATTSKSKKKASPSTGVSELGEVLKEEDKRPSSTVRLRVPSPRKSADVSRKSADIRPSADTTRKSAEVSEQAPEISTKEKDGLGDGVVAAGATTMALVSAAEESQPITLPHAEESSTHTEEAAKPIEEAQPTIIQVGEESDKREPTTSTPAAEEHVPTRVLETITEDSPIDEPTSAIVVENVEEPGEQTTAPVVEELTPAPEETVVIPPVEVVQDPIAEAHVFSTANITPEQPALAEDVFEPVVVEEPVIELPASKETEAPAVSEPVIVEEPAPERSTAEGPVTVAVEEPVPVQEAPIEEIAAAEPATVVEELTEDTVLIEEPDTEHAPIEAPATDAEPSAVDATVPQPVTAEEPTPVPIQEATVVEEIVPVYEEESVVDSVAEEEQQVAQSDVVEREPVTEGAIAEEEPEIGVVEVAASAPTEEPPLAAASAAPVDEEPSIIEEPAVVEETEPEQPIVEDVTVEAPEVTIPGTGVAPNEPAADEESATDEELAATPVGGPVATDEPVTIEEPVAQEHAMEESDTVEDTQAIEEAVDIFIAANVGEESSVNDEPTVVEAPPAVELVAVEEVATVVAEEEPVTESAAAHEHSVADELASEESAAVVEETPEPADTARDEIAEEPATADVDPTPEVMATEVPIIQEPDAPIEDAPEAAVEPSPTEAEGLPHEQAPITVGISHEEAVIPPVDATPEPESAPAEPEESSVGEPPAIHEPVGEFSVATTDASEETADEPAEPVDVVPAVIDEDAMDSSAPPPAAEPVEPVDVIPAVIDEDAIDASAPPPASEPAEPSIAPPAADEPAGAVETTTEPPAASPDDVTAAVTTTNGEATPIPTPEVANGNGHYTNTTEKEDITEEIPAELPAADDDAELIQAQVPSEPSEITSTTAKDD